ncbi:MAG: phosphate uptake regulator PhoU [Aeropyrum sp.]|nr:phosphate uptake regulator PhoU [Aeropyrum sp.]MCE4615867.1 phosphate uptake regulator PhoU [Aeropyrum sp.]
MASSSYIEADLENIYNMLDRLYNSVGIILGRVLSSLSEWREVHIDDSATMVELMASSIEDEATLFIARYQPLGPELIDSKAAIKVSYDLFRIARYAREIAHLISSVRIDKIDEAIAESAQAIEEMFKLGYKAFRDLNPELLPRVEELEKVCDEAYHKSLKILAESESVDKRDAITALTARHLERIADHIVYIAKLSRRRSK